MLLRAEKVELDIVFDSFGNSGTDGIFCGLVCAVHLEFVEYVFFVCYDGVDARIAQGGNFLCRFAFPVASLSMSCLLSLTSIATASGCISVTMACSASAVMS